MPVPGTYQRSQFGADLYTRTIANNNGAVTFAMASLNSGWCARFTAPDGRDIKSVNIDWGTVSAPGAFTMRVETIDATTGKPTGTLVDANAVATGVIPSTAGTLGWQNVPLGATPWTSHTTAGTEYGIVVLITTGGTTHTLRSSINVGAYPTIVLTAADGTTRSNFAEVANAIPILTIVFDDNSEESLACSPYATISLNNLVTTAACALKFTVPSGISFKLAGFEIGNLTRTGTPAGDLRFRLMDASNNVVSGSTLTADKDSMTGSSGSRARRHFGAVLSLAAGTYRAVLDSSGSANSSNCWAIRAAQARVAGNTPSGFSLSTTADVTASPIVWTDTTTDIPTIELILDDIVSSGAAPKFILS